MASAGLLPAAVPAERLEIEQGADQAGGDCTDDVALLRYGSTQAVPGHRVMAASTVGTWLRAFTFGHVRRLDRLTETILGRAWAAGAGPDRKPRFGGQVATKREPRASRALGKTGTAGWQRPAAQIACTR